MTAVDPESATLAPNLSSAPASVRLIFVGFEINFVGSLFASIAKNRTMKSAANRLQHIRRSSKFESPLTPDFSLQEVSRNTLMYGSCGKLERMRFGTDSEVIESANTEQSQGDIW